FLRLVLRGALRRRRLTRRSRTIHDALPMEDATLLDDEGLGGDIAIDPSAPGQMGLALDHDVALEPSGDAHVLGADVGLDLTLLRQRHLAVGVDLSFDLPIDAQRSRGHHVALQSRADADDRDLTVV